MSQWGTVNMFGMQSIITFMASVSASWLLKTKKFTAKFLVAAFWFISLAGCFCASLGLAACDFCGAHSRRQKRVAMVAP